MFWNLFIIHGLLTQESASVACDDERWPILFHRPGFIINISIARKLQNLPVGHSDRIMSLRIPIQDQKFAIVLSVFAPTLQAEIGIKEAFYSYLHDLLQWVNSADIFLILGDFNARMGWNFELWKESYVDMELAAAMTMSACFWSSVLSISSSSPTPCSNRRVCSRQHGDTHVPNTGTSWTTSWLSSMTQETYYTPEWCPVQTATLITGWYAAKSPFP